MAGNALSVIDRKRLRGILAIFFLALLIPTTVLIFHAYKQLKWESFRHYQLQAEELSSRIDADLLRMMATEEKRPFADYQFLVVEGDDTTNFLQRSPLSAFPLPSDIPGLIGYFQIDTEGNLSTPLLPVQSGEGAIYGMPLEERSGREALQRRIQAILTDNRLVAGRKQDLPEITEELDAPLDREQHAASVPREESARGLASRSSRDESTLAAAKKSDSVVQPQTAFDRLGEPGPPRQAETKQKISSLGRVEDLKLEKRFLQREDKDERRASGDGSGQHPALVEIRRPRKEQSQWIESEEISAAPPQPWTGMVGRDTRIRTFESEVDPFNVSRLNGGEFVMFRNVWREGQRFVQGALIQGQPFLAGVIRSAFTGSVLSRMSNLIVAYRGEIIGLFNVGSARTYLPDSTALQGELLYQTRLGVPLSELELIFSIDRLPAGPGAALINWLAAIMLSLLCGGFYLLYRLGGKQIDLSRQQQDFISAVSHELKTPLTSIRMYGEILREGWAGEEKRQGYYRYIHDESERLSRLIDNVLQLARMTRNQVKINCVSIRVNDLMQTVQSRAASQVDAAGFKMEIGVNESAGRKIVEVDTDGFTQIIINLVDNGLKFSGKESLKQIDIGCRDQSNDSVLFTVRDYGPGIPKAQMKKIFKLFYRSENELTRETMGTGIGLALVKQLAHGMNGQVDVVNRNPGAEFQLTLPSHGEANPL